jgi:hypothetical protein
MADPLQKVGKTTEWTYPNVLRRSSPGIFDEGIDVYSKEL